MEEQFKKISFQNDKQSSNFCSSERKVPQIKKIAKKRDKNQDVLLQRRAEILIIPTKQENFIMKMPGDVLISLGGQVRLCFALSHICFGYQQTVGEVIEYMKDINCYNIRLKLTDTFPICSSEDALIILDKYHPKKDIHETFSKFNYRLLYYQKEMDEFRITDHEYLQKEETFEEFTQYCYSYLSNINRQAKEQSQQDISINFQSLNEQIQPVQDHQDGEELNNIAHIQASQQNQSISSSNPNLGTQFINANEDIIKQMNSSSNSYNFDQNQNKQSASLGMFSYGIGRVDWKSKEMKIIHSGYSAGYLKFLGLDQLTLSSLILRDKRIDLVSDNVDITNYSVQRLDSWANNIPICEYTTNIVTFDGFPIQIHQKSIKMNLPDKFQGQLKSKPEYVFQITEIDVDIEDLQKLIMYRQQFIDNPHSLPMDIFLQRELSKKFEDIEYSIHSEAFVQKYYKENLPALIQLQNQKGVSFSLKPRKSRHLKPFNLFM